MELMDESLTSFLERTSARLPFHVQVNIAYDVAQALAYLHSHEVLHRDLSSNNVLMIGGSRAKVTDFGMSRLSDVSHVSTPRPLTQLPGTEVYMAPEAFKEPPEYTSKLDCFSLGVLAIQIITRKFPCPGSRRRQIRVPNSQSTSGQAEVLVNEVERRRSHIALIDDKHPLLLISLDCLKDDDKARPTAEQLVLQLSGLRESVRYRESAGGRGGSGGSGEEVQGLQRELEQAVRRAEASEQLVADLQQSLNQKDEVIRSNDLALRSKDEIIRFKDEALRSNEAVIRSKDELLFQERQIEDLQRGRQGGRQGGRRDSGVGTGPLNLEWKDETSCPIETHGESSAVHGKIAYFCDGESNTKILKYNSETGEWDILECLKWCFSITVVKELVTAIGGMQFGEATKTLLSLTGQQKWTEQFPPMKYYHYSPGVATTSTSLIVAGGWGPDEEKAPVEVMDTESLCWSTAASLPYPRHLLTTAICGDRLYLGGGFQDLNSVKSVLTCSVSDLIQSAVPRSQSLAARVSSALKFRPPPPTVWTETAELPLNHSSLVTLQGRLLAVGGYDRENNDSSAVLQYDTATNTWKITSHMKNTKYQCLTASLPGNKLIVVGGYYGSRVHTASVEIASIV